MYRLLGENAISTPILPATFGSATAVRSRFASTSHMRTRQPGPLPPSATANVLPSADSRNRNGGPIYKGGHQRAFARRQKCHAARRRPRSRVGENQLLSQEVIAGQHIA